MNDNVVYYVDLEKERRRAKFREKFPPAVLTAWDWCMEHPDLAVTALTAGIGLVTVGVKTFGKSVNLRKEKALKENYCYDRSLGMYWKLKRALTNQEWQAIDRRKANGERLGNILSDMNVLK